MVSVHPDQYENFIFDFDGTLLNLDVEWARLREEVAQEFPLGRSAEHDGFTTLVDWIVRRKGADGRAKVAKIIKKYEQPAGRIRISRINERVVEFASKLSNFYVISNNLNSTITAGIAFLNIGTRCRQVIGFDDVLRSKPNEEPYKKLCSLHPLSGRTVYIGDRDTDLEFAKKLRIDFISTKDIEDI